MRSLWFRAAQTRSSCRCNACVKIGSTIARQTTNAIGKRRRVSIGDIFTACYSTILATAAVADSNRKAQRREQWDQLIAEAKVGLPTDKVEERQDCPVKGSANEVENQISGTPELSKMPGFLRNKFSFSKAGLNATKAGSTGPMTWDGASWTAASSMSRLGTQLNIASSNITKNVESIAPDTSQDPGPSPTILPVKSAKPENIALERFGEYIPSNSMLQPREVKTRKHLDGVETSIAKLVHQLMWTTKLSPIAADFHSASSNIFLQTERMIERVEELQRGDITMPTYQMDAEVGEERSQLHDALMALFKKTSPGQNNLNLILAKICYNLLISSVSPNIFTYNFLIEKLTELMLHDHAQIIVDSFLYDTKFKPTPRTIQVILNHYAVKNDLEGYRSIIRRMRAVDGSMRVARRHPNQLFEHPKYLAWAEKHAQRLISRDGWLVRKVPRDESIFDALIKTSSHITTARQAVMYIRASLRQNIKIRPESLCEAVTSCVAQLDHAAGESLLKSILESWAENIEKPDLIALTKSTRWAMRELLHLCGIDPSRDLPQNLPVDVPRWNLGRLLFYLNLGSIRDSVDRFVARVNSLHDILQISSKRSKYNIIHTWHREYPEFGDTQVRDYLPKDSETRNRSSSQSSIDRCLEIFQNFETTEKARAKKARQTARQARRVMLQSLEAKVALSNANIFSTEMCLVSLHYDRLPRDWKYTYHLRLKQSPYMSYGHRIAVLEGLKRLQKLHIIGYQINLSLRHVVLLQREIYYIEKEREQRITDLAVKINVSAKQIKRLAWRLHLVKERIKLNSQSLRLSGLREMNVLEDVINRSKRHIKLLEQELQLDFPHVNPERKMKKLNSILYKVNQRKHHIKLLAEEIYLSYPPFVARKTYTIDSNSSWKVLRGAHRDLTFQYDPPVDKLLPAEEQEYEVIQEHVIERTIRFKQRQENLLNEERVSSVSFDSSV
ncbi:13323190-a0d2-4069-a5a2-bd032a87d9bd-CDS [Sclerotinia trifoliorum]|uniref:13323190-a0d2-4069-a5a2-bd032a87d9bd-CDS n=1 Tax=Sclerotinia trifoliorum TaxID=28548 RepID=A0A8H2VZ60_9HELO|nr:13323190-a0d2-4069-a5a2-bd032a87d9bd-CDS [Sclerotinia trifoliorum]